MFSLRRWRQDTPPKIDVCFKMVRCLKEKGPLVDMTGQIQWVSGSKWPLRNQAGDIVGLVGVFHDITERKQLKLKREAMIADLETKMPNWNGSPTLSPMT